ncbi:hypothetical protein CI109_101039 [Kwoniella shandongensis]|uniref:Uncharacterized protein n=1 Tax=Kwoniella shandongensis TaxID=1734106 RepID=A0A5M6C4T3_9TREE|nr:uncharacterized protein CI109_001508 [Kwoniella shandongensis]KAA5530104.1 hypothetical protein CI109_001508 [Kwoniella shandongensis]
MIPSPRRAVSTPAVHTWPDVDDDDGWQDMPVVRSDDNPFGLDEEDQKRYHYRPPARLDDSSLATAGGSSSNATGTHLEVQADTLLTDSWREKVAQDESDYTRLRLNEDEESEEVHMRTRYLFDEDKAMTPLSQMQATKELLTEGQRIAYVGLCQLIARRMLKDMGRGWEGVKVRNMKLGVGKGKTKGEVPVVESGHIWMLKIMARLYQHMELAKEEQRMIESLAEHGVDPSDLVPALMTTHTVNNPDYDPKAKEKADLDAAAEIESKEEEKTVESEKERLRLAEEEEEEERVRNAEAPPPPYEAREEASGSAFSSGRTSPVIPPPVKSVNPFGDDDDEEEAHSPIPSSSKPKSPQPTPKPPSRLPSFDVGDDDDGDIGSILSPPPSAQSSSSSPSPSSPPLPSPPPPETTQSPPDIESTPEHDPDKTPKVHPADHNEPPLQIDEPDMPAALPSLPGVSTSLSNTDELVTLDIRWTVLCDLFLVLIADSVYDARSRAFLLHVASALGFGWLDVARFENRVTDALEIQEGVERTEQGDIIEGRRKAARNKRYAMMGAAAIGGGLVIGLSAGLAAPFIGAGLGAAFATVGITGTGTFLAGAGGAAIITTGGVLTGANIAGKGMAKRTREVRTFEFRPLHNNKRVSCYITVGGFMASKVDDVRLPFSVLDPIVGDVYSVHWEPEMMAEMGSAMAILTGEILTQVGQQVLQATVMTALLSALQWPIILTKLGYLIDNPWSNALDRARAAGYVLADTIIQRHAGVRPISLIGYSLGARAIFYALIELARHKAYGLVQDVFIFGTTVTASKATWLDVRSVVAGRFVNGYATNDWMLGYLFRATTGGLNTVAGLRPVETVAGLENVDVTEIITGHMSYRSCMPQLLAKVGFPVTADYFDEPDDPEMDMSVQERTIVNEAEEEAKRNRKKILGIFPVKDKASRSSTSGTSTPNPNNPGRTSGGPSPNPAKGGEYEYDDEDADADGLPPREEADLGDLSSNNVGETNDEARRKAALEEEKARKEEEEAVKAIPKTAGFDFQAISRELGRDIDLKNLKQPIARPIDSVHTDPRAPLERSGSAPPPASITISPPPPPMDTNAWSSTTNTSTSKSASISRFATMTPDEDEGDIGGTTATDRTRGLSISDVSIPSWDRPTTGVASSSISPPLLTGGSVGSASANTSASRSSFSWGGGGWGSNNQPIRAAPPARPHPPELINPFAGSANGWAADGPALGGFVDAEKEKKRKEEEEWAEKNPW